MLNKYVSNVKEYTTQCYRDMDFLKEILGGNLSSEKLQRYAIRHYAEIRTFLELKIPERLRLCPPKAYSARKYFWYLYKEEHGFFKPGENHAELFVPVCHSLGITDEEMEQEYQQYWPKYKYMFSLTPSDEVLIQELAVSVAWESFSPVVGPELIKALKGYGISEKGLTYFSLHYEVDQRHGDQAYKALNDYVIDEETEATARDAIRNSLIENVYFNM